eukprot:m.339718 g.339718  ORF g.339718 m.339718 type:complete len:320 (+) comp16096_c0_seq15:1947-2906(+)
MRDVARSLKIYLVVMTPHCTHGLQPCDKLFNAFHHQVTKSFRDNVMRADHVAEQFGLDPDTDKLKLPPYIELVVSAFYTFCPEQQSIVNAWRKCGVVVEACLRTTTAPSTTEPSFPLPQVEQVRFRVGCVVPVATSMNIRFHFEDLVPQAVDELSQPACQPALKLVEQLPSATKPADIKLASDTLSEREALLEVIDYHNMQEQPHRPTLEVLKSHLARIDADQRNLEKKIKKELASGVLNIQVRASHAEHNTPVRCTNTKRAREHVFVWAKDQPAFKHCRNSDLASLSVDMIRSYLTAHTVSRAVALCHYCCSRSLTMS